MENAAAARETGLQEFRQKERERERMGGGKREREGWVRTSKESEMGRVYGGNERKLLRSRILTIQLGKSTLQLEWNRDDDVSWV